MTIITLLGFIIKEQESGVAYCFEGCEKEVKDKTGDRDQEGTLLPVFCKR